MLLERLRGHIRVVRNQKAELSVGIIDNQSVKWGNNHSLNGVDGHKQVKGIKRHIIVDTNGFLIAVMVTIANIHDCTAAYLLMRALKKLCLGIKVMLADERYKGDLIENVKTKLSYVIQVVVSAYKEQGFKPIHKRWIVERSFSWMENDRRLCRNYKLTFESAEEKVKTAVIKLLLKKNQTDFKSLIFLLSCYYLPYICNYG